MTMPDDVLDRMLAEPLDAVADDGFSARAIARVNRGRIWRDRLNDTMPIAAVGAVAAFLPLGRMGEAVLHVSSALLGSSAVALAVGALVLTYSLDQKIRE